MRLAILFFFGLVVVFLAAEADSPDKAHVSLLKKHIDTSKTNEASDEEFGDAFEDDFAEEFEEEFKTSAEMDEFDPLSGYNRMMTSFNDTFYTDVLFPVARGYRYVVPEDGRLAISNFFDNLLFPIRFVNNVLQLKVLNAAEELGRFAINTTIGLLGFFDPAEAWFGLEAHDEDFGQTLGYYGVGEGFHIVLPFLGPSNLRDTLGIAVDWEIDPLVYQHERGYNITKRTEEGLIVKTYDYLNEGSFNIEEYESLKKDAIDLYPFFKNIYKQSREKKIKE